MAFGSFQRLYLCLNNNCHDLHSMIAMAYGKLTVNCFICCPLWLRIIHCYVTGLEGTKMDREREGEKETLFNGYDMF